MRPTEPLHPGTFYVFKPPWVYENEPLLMRLFELGRTFYDLSEHFARLRAFETQYASGLPAKHSDCKLSIHFLTQGVELFLYLFPDLGRQRWFQVVWDALAKAHWRVEEGRLETSPDEMKVVLRDIVEHWEGTPENRFPDHLYDFLRYQWDELSTHDVLPEFETDVSEARDLAILGHYSTALFVLGRGVERALLLVGEARKVERIQLPSGKSLRWTDCTFHQRNEALRHVPAVVRDGSVLTRSQYLQIKVLIDHRNMVAHPDYHAVRREDARRVAQQAYALMRDVGVLVEDLRKNKRKVRKVESVILPKDG
jgi:hypothetical protein